MNLPKNLSLSPNIFSTKISKFWLQLQEKTFPMLWQGKNFFFSSRSKFKNFTNENIFRDRLVLFDFDGTLATFKDNKQGLWDIFLKKGISDKIIKENYQKVINNAFNLEKFADSFENLEKEEVLLEMQNWLNKNITLYPDAGFIKNKDFSFVLFTFGDLKYQIEKINAVEIKPDLFLFSEKFPKIQTIKSFITSLKSEIENKGPVVFIDNSFLELDAVRDEGYSEKEIITIWINRKKLNEKPKYKHLEINSLNELNF